MTTFPVEMDVKGRDRQVPCNWLEDDPLSMET